MVFGFGKKNKIQGPVATADVDAFIGANVAAVGKVSLAKGTSSIISLAKGAKVTASLKWNGGSAVRRSKGADLELYALYVTKEQASKLSKSQGGAVYWNNLSVDGMRHHGDSLVAGTETVTIDSPEKFDYVLIVAYSAVNNGTGSFKSFGAKAVVSDGTSTVEVPLYNKNHYSYWVAIALVDLKDSANIKISHVETYSKGGENRPVLYSDGSFQMDIGPREFKR